MARLLELESFEGTARASRAAVMDDGEVAEQKLQSYEKGYAAGWDDALLAQAADIARLRADLGRNLTEMTLSFQEARSHVLASLEPLLGEMVAKVLPMIARQSLAHFVLEQLTPVAEQLAGTGVEVRTAPQNVETIERLLAGEGALPVRVVADETLGEGQVFLRTGAHETVIDLDEVVTAIGSAVSAFFDIRRSEDAP